MQKPQPTRPDWVSASVVLLLSAPVAVGLAGTLLPAAGFLPALGGHQVSLTPVRDLLEAPAIWTSAALSAGTGLAATALSLLVVLLFVATLHGTRPFGVLSRLMSPLLSVPHAAAAFGLAFLIAPSGFLVRLFSPWATGFERPPDLLILNDPLGLAMTFGLVIKEVPFLFLMALAALPQTNADQLSKAAQNLGYSKTSAFFRVVLPVLYPQIRLPIIAVLAYSTSVVDVAQILGPTTPAPLAPRILGWMADPDPAMRFQASAGAVLQCLLSGGAILLWLAGERVVRGLLQASTLRGKRRRREHTARCIGFILTAGTVFPAILGLAVLGLWSISKGWWFPSALPSGFTISHWADLGKTGTEVIWQTLVIAVSVTLVCLILVISVLESRTRMKPSGDGTLRKLVFVPLLIPQVSFLFGLQILSVLVGIDGSLLGVAMAHAIFVLPYMYLAFADPWNHLDPRYQQVAMSFGASKWKVLFRIRLPLLMRPLLVTLAIGIAVSVGQYLPTIMIGAGRVTTVTTESLALSSGGNRSLIAVYGMLQLLLPLMFFAAAAIIPALLHRDRSGLRV
ncbi:putative thiamine transport system permease protein [Roseibium hamelinense]|uniref:Putative thiamine transport system permease protein n=1 Tax=Roseibium hamelinense TaxID=150831 RepID=A0A562SJ29_9HYPH|nr:ABC transporter permease subunit [Roseibium hamelinense]MTI43955.1 ABC transporter permease subunit [Roseibium hamelinense]TWI80750.1 putative thiamine transport system permease protein [Roseibium hamelinense]